jgi:hypothetical protein
MANNDNNCKLHQFERNHYFYGKLMTVRDFETEQSYMNEKRSLINRLIHGAGIVCGFYDIDGTKGITLAKINGKLSITFNNGGIALDCCGREIVVPAGSVKELTIPAFDNNLLYLYLKYKECKRENVNAASNASSCDETCCPNRIFEDFEVVALPNSPKYSTITCPTLTSVATTRAEINASARDFVKDCSSCSDPKLLVFIAAVKDNVLEIDPIKTREYMSFVYNNKLLAELLNCQAEMIIKHISDNNNPHKTQHSQLPDILQVDPTKTDATPGKHVSNANANKWETHSNTVGNPHTTQHSQLLDILQVDPTKTDATPGKHVSNKDANKWNSAIFTVNGLGPNPNKGDFSINPGNSNITITSTPGTNEITIASRDTVGGGAECYTGIINFKGVKPNTVVVSPRDRIILPGRPCIMLSIVYDELKYIVAGDEIRKSELEHTNIPNFPTYNKAFLSNMELTSFLLFISDKESQLIVMLRDTRRDGIPKDITVRWCATVPTRNFDPPIDA